MSTRQEVTTIPATKRHMAAGGQLASARQIRVAAYCRVSTDEMSQQSSYATQCRYYTELISRKAEWTMAGLYADEAISGTCRAKRKEFNRMMDDARAGKIDYIITKSISRFARNTLDTLECVRELRNQAPPVGVFFEKESVDSLDAKGELLLTILSALAQDESRSISDNIRWAFQKKFQAGIPQINLSQMYGYDKGDKGEWIINEAQAQVVRYMFRRCLEGCSASKIATELNASGKTTVKGNRWNSNAVLFVLQNEKYVGDIEMQKTVTVDFLTHQSQRNDGVAPKYYVKNHHEAIIDRFTWDKVQAIFQGKKERRESEKAGSCQMYTLENGSTGSGDCADKDNSSGTSDGTGKRRGDSTGTSDGTGKRRGDSSGTSDGTGKRRGDSSGTSGGTGKSNGRSVEDSAANYGRQKKRVAPNKHPLHNLTCAACGGAYKRYGYTATAVGYEDERSADLTEEERASYKETYTYIYRVWRCETKYKGHEKKHGTLSEQERADYEKQCPSPILYEAAIEQSFMAMLYILKREYEQKGEACSFAENFRATCEKVKNMCRKPSRYQGTEMPFLNTTGQGGKDPGEWTCSLMKRSYDLFLQCLMELPETNRAGMKLAVCGRDTIGVKIDSCSNTAGAKIDSCSNTAGAKIDSCSNTADAITVDKAYDFLEFDRGIYQAFFPRAVVRENTIEFITNFGIKFTCSGIDRDLSAFCGFRRAHEDGTVELLTQNWQVNGSCIQYRRRKRIYKKRNDTDCGE